MAHFYFRWFGQKGTSIIQQHEASQKLTLNDDSDELLREPSGGLGARRADADRDGVAGWLVAGADEDGMSLVVTLYRRKQIRTMSGL